MRLNVAEITKQEFESRKIELGASIPFYPGEIYARLNNENCFDSLSDILRNNEFATLTIFWDPEGGYGVSKAKRLMQDPKYLQDLESNSKIVMFSQKYTGNGAIADNFELEKKDMQWHIIHAYLRRSNLSTHVIKGIYLDERNVRIIS